MGRPSRIVVPLPDTRPFRGRGVAHAALVVVLLLAWPARPGRAEPAADPLFEDDAAAAQPMGFPDPLEKVNRCTFRANLVVDRFVLDPVASAYAFVVPAPGRRAVRRALANLNAPATFVNDVLQLEPRDAGVTVARFALNTTVGVAGIFDVAEKIGLERHDSDFGQTLALAGLPSGPYVVLPVLGPTTARDGTGYLVDFLFRPTTYFLAPATLLVSTSIQEGSAGIAAREQHDEALRALEASSMDYYAAFRNAYYQDRTAQIWSRREHRRPVALATR